MPDNTDTIKAFLNVFAAPIAAPATAIATVMGLFSPDAAGPPPTPSVGIGGNTQDPEGPAFRGRTAITALFAELLSSFPNLVFTAWPAPATPVFCIAQADPNTMIIQAQLNTDVHTKRWFPPNAPDGRRYYSKPLSDIVPDGIEHSTVPVCAVFTFDPQNPIAANQF